MNSVFIVLLLVSLACLILGLIRPTTLSRLVKSEITRKKAGLIFGTATIVFFILFGVTSGASSEESASQTPGSTQTETKQLSSEELARKAEEAAAEKKRANEEKAKEAEAAKELDADVRFSSTAVMIKNNESKNWTGCKFVLNGKLFGSDFTYKTTEGIDAKDSIIILMDDFTKSDGTRFDPYSTKAMNLFLACEVGSNHRTNYYTFSE